jgi:hypothetical protein
MDLGSMNAKGLFSKQPSRTTPNIANKVRSYIEENHRALCGIHGLWITGSTIWKLLYDETPDGTQDLDVFVLDETRRSVVKALLEHLVIPAPAGSKTLTSMGGERLHFPNERSLDLWVAEDPIDAISNYDASHSHARVAYCPYNGALIVIANEAA